MELADAFIQFQLKYIKYFSNILKKKQEKQECIIHWAKLFAVWQIQRKSFACKHAVPMHYKCQNHGEKAKQLEKIDQKAFKDVLVVVKRPFSRYGVLAGDYEAKDAL